jgi:hypothetical protein
MNRSLITGAAAVLLSLNTVACRDEITMEMVLRQLPLEGAPLAVPGSYGSRDNAGHTATMVHPGGGEFANVASSWAKYQLKGDAEAGKMFVGTDCNLCVLPTWETAAKGME